MSIGTVEKMESLILECEAQIALDGSEVWANARDALKAAVAYQRDKQEAALRKAYGG